MRDHYDSDTDSATDTAADDDGCSFGSLPRVSGTLPVPGVGPAEIRWERRGHSIHYEINSPSEWTLLKNDGTVQCEAGVTGLKLSSLDGQGPYVP